MFKKMVSVFLMVVMVGTMAAGCQGKNDSGSKEEKSEKLRVGIMPSTVGVPVQYAYDKGYFEEEGLDIEISVFQTGAPVNEAIVAKQIDLAASGAASIFSLASGNCTLLAELDVAGGMGIYVRPDSEILKEKGKIEGLSEMYGSAESLKGKTFLGQLGTSSQLNVIRYAEQFGLEADDYTVVHMDAGPAYQAFIAGEGDALAAYPPYSFYALSEGMVEAATFEDSSGFSMYDAIFGRTEVIDKHPEDIEKFMKCVMKATEEMKDDALRKEYSMEFFAANGREYTEEDMDDEIAVRAYMGKEEFLDSNYVFGKAFADQCDFYVENGKITEDQVPKLYDSLNPEYLNKALDIDLKAAAME